MIKIETFHFFADGENFDEFLKETKEFDEKVQEFVFSLEEAGHTFLSMNSVSYGRKNINNRIRTQVVYRDNEIRKTLTEKIK